MLAAYQSGDPYLEFAKQAGRVPADGTKETHRAERELFKQCVLATQYGMESKSLAERIGAPEIVARDLLRAHRETYPRFWRWSDGAVDYAMLHGQLHTAFGWTIHRGSDPNPRMLRNFPMQGNGAEMMRLACCLATEQNIGVCAPVHDALLIEAPETEIGDAVVATQAAMAQASRDVLDGFELRSDTKIWRHPERYQDERGSAMWRAVWDLLPARIRAGDSSPHLRACATDLRACAHPVPLLSDLIEERGSPREGLS
jgi:DNA polymerase I-like protein with 3'-5' exonuclease and polymerase domains